MGANHSNSSAAVGNRRPWAFTTGRMALLEPERTKVPEPFAAGGVCTRMSISHAAGVERRGWLDAGARAPEIAPPRLDDTAMAGLAFRHAWVRGRSCLEAYGIDLEGAVTLLARRDPAPDRD